MNKLIIVLVVGTLFLFYSCSNKDNPVTPQDKPYPVGIPEWNSREYDWIDSSYIHWWEYPKPPKYAISILGCSPDGNNLIVQDLSYSKVYIFDVNNNIFKFLINGNNVQADWSKSGRLIGIGLSSLTNLNKYIIYDWEKKSYYFISAPDTFKWVSETFEWWEQDSTFLTTFMKADDKISHRYEVNIHPPYKLKIRDDLNYDFTQNNNFRYTFNNDSSSHFHCYLEIKDLNNGTIGSYLIPGITFPQSSILISPDGEYLAFIGSADLTGTKRYDLFMQNGLGGNLVILKLDELSAGNLIYRFFPDYNNHYRGKFYSQYINIGAWSSDSKYFYQTYYQPDSTIQIVRRNIYTGNVEFLTNLKAAP
jgi:hypothetical protein